MRAIDLFAGAGGFSSGAKAAGHDIVWAANHDPVAVQYHRANHQGTPHSQQDLRQADWSELPDFELMLASPACQGHSPAGQPGRSRSPRARAKHDRSRSTAFAVIDCADVRRPRHLVVENVPAFRNWALYPLWKSMLERLGYMLEELLVDAADAGVPTERKRLFIVGSLLGQPHIEPASQAHRPVTDVLTGGTWAPVASKPPGVRDRVAQGARRWGPTFLTQHTTGHPGRPLSRPIGTITTAASHWHLVNGDHIRALTTKELAAASGFPDDYILPPATSQATRLIGNAVCPPVATWITQQLE